MHDGVLPGTPWAGGDAAGHGYGVPLCHTRGLHLPYSEHMVDIIDGPYDAKERESNLAHLVLPQC